MRGNVYILIVCIVLLFSGCAEGKLDEEPAAKATIKTAKAPVVDSEFETPEIPVTEPIETEKPDLTKEPTLKEKPTVTKEPMTTSLPETTVPTLLPTPEPTPTETPKPTPTETPKPTPTETPKPTPTKVPKPSATTKPSSTPKPTPKPIVFTGEIKDISDAKVGDSIIFGNYEQDNDLENGEEPIEWLVLEEKNDELLLITKMLLLKECYHDERVPITWEECTLRIWLNSVFFETAFSENEREKIVVSHLKNEDNPKWGNEGGNDTDDKVFMLSYKEAVTYFSADPDYDDVNRRGCPTAYLLANNGWAYYEDMFKCYGSNKYDGYSWWYLRTPSLDGQISVDYTGRIFFHGRVVSYSEVFTRPVIRVKK